MQKEEFNRDPYTLSLRVHLVQLDIAWEDRPANRARVGALVADAGVEPGDLIVLPEMFDTGFSFNIAATADHDGATQAFLKELARTTRTSVVGGFTALGPDGRGRNRALAIGPGGDLLAQYDKSHLFPLGQPSEAASFTPGRGVSTFEWAGVPLRVAPLICYDLRFPELFGDALALGAEAYCIIANWPRRRDTHWRALAIARAIENQAYIFAVNRTGNDPTLEYAGGSLIIDPRGVILGEADAREQVLSGLVTREEVTFWRKSFSAWRERKTAPTG